MRLRANEDSIPLEEALDKAGATELVTNLKGGLDSRLLPKSERLWQREEVCCEHAAEHVCENCKEGNVEHPPMHKPYPVA